MLLGIKTHRMTQKNIDWIRTNGMGGRDGTLIKLIPLLKDETTEGAGAKISQVLHATPRMQKTDRAGSDHCCFEMWMTNKKANIYFWARDEQQLSRVLEQYKVNYPGMDFEKQTDQYFPLLKEGQCCAVARLQYKKHWVYPLAVIEDGKGWNEILGATATDQSDQTVIIQIVMKPLRNKKSWKGKMVAVKRKQTTHDPDSPYSHLTNLISAKADQPPFYVEIRVVVIGDIPSLIKKKTENILGTFQRFSSESGGNQLKTVPCNISWCVGLNAVEDRDIRHFVTPLDFRMQMSSDELGHNFLSIPMENVEPLQYSHVWKREMPEEVEKIWSETPETVMDAVKVELTLRELTPEEAEKEEAEILKQEIEVRGETKETTPELETPEKNIDAEKKEEGDA